MALEPISPIYFENLKGCNTSKPNVIQIEPTGVAQLLLQCANPKINWQGTSEIWDPSCFSHFKGNAWGRIYTTNGFPTRFWFQNQENHFQWKLFTGQLYAPHHPNGMRNLPTFEFWGVSAKYLPVTTYPIQIFGSNIWFLHCSNQIALLQGFCVVLIFHNISTPNNCCKDIVPTHCL